jgi:hypothetical protein
MTALEDLTSKDLTRIRSACAVITDSRDRKWLKELSDSLRLIRENTQNLELGGALCPNSYHVDFVIKKLQFIRRSDECLCALYTDNMFFNPTQEQEKKRLQISDTIHIDGKWVDYYLCECTQCQSKFKVEERYGHYMWWSWKKIIT